MNTEVHSLSCGAPPRSVSPTSKRAPRAVEAAQSTVLLVPPKQDSRPWGGSIVRKTREGALEREWPMTFKQAICGQFDCRPEQYEAVVFWRVVFRHALPLAWLIRRLSPEFFSEDLDLIREVGEMRSPELFNNELNYFHGRNIRHRSWIRTVLKVRVSGARLLRLRRRVLG